MDRCGIFSRVKSNLGETVLLPKHKVSQNMRGDAYDTKIFPCTKVAGDPTSTRDKNISLYISECKAHPMS